MRERLATNATASNATSTNAPEAFKGAPPTAACSHTMVTDPKSAAKPKDPPEKILGMVPLEAEGNRQPAAPEVGNAID